VIIEMHCHTSEHSSCSHVSAVEVVRWMVDKGVQGIVLTDHHYLWNVDEIRKLRREAGVPRHFVILAGQETDVPRFGHVLIYGADDTVPQGTSIDEIRTRHPDVAIAWAHPYRSGAHPRDADLTDPGLDAVEIFSSNHSADEAYRGLEDWHRLRFTAIAGTDTHARSYGGAYPTIFDHPVDSIEELVREMKVGRCRPFFKEIPRSGTTRTEVTEIAFGTKGLDERRQRLIVKRHESDGSWSKGERTFRIMQAFAERGFADGRYRIPEPLGRDESKRALIERGMRGRTLFERITQGDVETARTSLELSATWLARLHNLGLEITSPEEFFEGERTRLARYVQGLDETDHPRVERVREAKERVLAEELRRYQGHPERLVQGHGDFHLKNILVGQDRADDRGTIFVAAIDFASSHRMPRAFDVGTFLAQFRNQLFHYPGALEAVSAELFLDTYVRESDELPLDFPVEIEIYKARAGLSILYYLNKVGMGDSEDFWRVLVETEHSLAAVAVHGSS
jgi:hypothetical protein